MIMASVYQNDAPSEAVNLTVIVFS